MSTRLAWSAARSAGDHVGFESWLERDLVMLLDADPTVAAVVSQPFWLSWPGGGRRIRHAPDFFARLRCDCDPYLAPVNLSWPDILFD
jgi:hypothetical protein